MPVTWPSSHLTNPIVLPDTIPDQPFNAVGEHVRAILDMSKMAGRETKEQFPDLWDLDALLDYDLQVRIQGHAAFILNHLMNATVKLAGAKRAAVFLDVSEYFTPLDAALETIEPFSDEAELREGVEDYVDDWEDFDEEVRGFSCSLAEREALIDQFNDDAPTRIRAAGGDPDIQANIQKAVEVAKTAQGDGQKPHDAFKAGQAHAMPLYIADLQATDPGAAQAEIAASATLQMRSDFEHFAAMQSADFLDPTPAHAQLEQLLTNSFLTTTAESDTKLDIRAALWLHNHPHAKRFSFVDYIDALEDLGKS